MVRNKRMDRRQEENMDEEAERKTRGEEKRKTRGEENKEEGRRGEGGEEERKTRGQEDDNRRDHSQQVAEKKLIFQRNEELFFSHQLIRHMKWIITDII